MPSGVYYEVTALIAYPGTKVTDELRQKGRLSGGDLMVAYTPADPVAARFQQGLTRLSLATGGPEDIALYAHHVASSVAVARRLGLPTVSVAIEREMAELIDEVNRARLAAYQSLLALSHTELLSEDRAQVLAVIAGALLTRLRRTERGVKALHHRLEPGIVAGTERGRLLSARAVSGFVVLSLGAAVACGARTPLPTANAGAGGEPSTMSSSPRTTPGGAGGGTTSAWRSLVSSVEPTSSVPSSSTTSSTTTGTTTYWDCGLDALDGSTALTCNETPSPWSSYSLTPNSPSPCTATELGVVVSAMRGSNVPCDAAAFATMLVVDGLGRVVQVQDYDNPAANNCVLAALADETFPCLAGDTIAYVAPLLLK